MPLVSCCNDWATISCQSTARPGKWVLCTRITSLTNWAGLSILASLWIILSKSNGISSHLLLCVSNRKSQELQLQRRPCRAVRTQEELLPTCLERAWHQDISQSSTEWHACRNLSPSTTSHGEVSSLGSPDVETPLLDICWPLEWMTHIVLALRLEYRALGCSCYTVCARTSHQIFPLSNQEWSSSCGE